MMAEDDIFRHPPPRPYAATGAQLLVPVTALEATLASLRRCGPLESCVFWYGTRDGDKATVGVVLTPQQDMRRRNYHVSPAAMSEMLADADEAWRPLAQIHSHPGSMVEHSTYDDEMVLNRRSLSIVFPWYGHWAEPWPTGIGVHEFQVDYWHLLDDEDAAARTILAEPAPIICRDFRQ